MVACDKDMLVYERTEGDAPITEPDEFPPPVVDELYRLNQGGGGWVLKCAKRGVYSKTGCFWAVDVRVQVAFVLGLHGDGAPSLRTLTPFPIAHLFLMLIPHY